MGRNQKLAYALGGFVLGVLLTSAVWLRAGIRQDTGIAAAPEDSHPGALAAVFPDPEPEEQAAPPLEPTGEEPDGSAAPDPPTDIWDSAAVYTGGDTVSHQGRRYRAKWWTQGERPGGSDVWEDLGILDGEAAQPEGVGNVPIDASAPRNMGLTDFKNLSRN